MSINRFKKTAEDNFLRSYVFCIIFKPDMACALEFHRIKEENKCRKEERFTSFRSF